MSDLLADASGPRGAFVAFVGADAPDYLPADLDGFELACWLQPGSTDPGALRVLLGRGARVLSADRLHMKVYWSEAGAVVASANLSANGLGTGGLYEAGVRLPAGALDVRRLRRSFTAVELTGPMLREHERRHIAYLARNGGRPPSDAPRRSGDDRGSRQRRRGSSFMDWYGTRFRQPWRWVETPDRYAGLGAESEAQVAASEQDGPENFATGAAGDFAPFEWTLLVDTAVAADDADEDMCEWFCPNWVSTLTPADANWYPSTPCEAVQLRPTAEYGKPPFRLDRRFRGAFVAALRELRRNGRATVPEGRPSARLLRGIQARLAATQR